MLDRAPLALTLSLALALGVLACDDTADTADGGTDAGIDAGADADADTGPDAAIDAAAPFDPARCVQGFEVQGCPCDGGEAAVCCGGEDALSCIDGSWVFMRMRLCHPAVADDAGADRPRRAQCDFGS